MNRQRYDWVAFLVCPRCGHTWRGILPNERPGAEGPILEQCPDCDIETGDDLAENDPYDHACSWCCGDGLCDDGADPLGTCPDEPHPCHACHGSGARKDQTIF